MPSAAEQCRERQGISHCLESGQPRCCCSLFSLLRVSCVRCQLTLTVMAVYSLHGFSVCKKLSASSSVWLVFVNYHITKPLLATVRAA